MVSSFNSLVARRLAPITGGNLLMIFWTIGFASVMGIFLHGLTLVIFSLTLELLLALLWFGYPVILYFYFSKLRFQVKFVVALLLLAILCVFLFEALGSYTTVFRTYNNFENTIELLLIAAVCATGAAALKKGELEAGLSLRANILVTSLAIFLFPIFGAYVHNRFRDVLSTRRD